MRDRWNSVEGFPYHTFLGILVKIYCKIKKLNFNIFNGKFFLLTRGSEINTELVKIASSITSWISVLFAFGVAFNNRIDLSVVREKLDQIGNHLSNEFTDQIKRIIEVCDAKTQELTN